MMTWRTMRAVLALTVGVLAGSGCDDATAPAATSIEGTFVLETANGRRLPTVGFSRPGYEIVVLAEEIDFSGDGRFFLSYTHRITNESLPPRNFRGVETGSYTQSGSEVALLADAGTGRQTGRIRGNRLTLRQDTVTLVFGRAR
ncbi:MAG TPA: hypothetical protein VE913_22795 [Longimicrobium sp.]|nr:hypothetical protein [Longimicrobium sp.]